VFPGAVTIGSEPVVALAIAVFLALVSIPIARKLAVVENDERLFRTALTSMGLRFLATVLLIIVVDHVYHGITDYNRYLNQGAALAYNFDHGHFSFAGTTLTTAIGPGAVSIAAGVVFAIIGVNKLAGFFVFSWLSFIGSIGFYRAFSITFPDADRRRYALLIFYLPSLLFWTSAISKESVMFFALGISAYGAAAILARRRAGYVFLVLGALIGIWIRPHEFVILVGGLVVATLVRNPDRSPAGGLRRLGSLSLQGGVLVGAVLLTRKLLHSSGIFSISTLSTVSQNNSYGSSVPYSASPLAYPRDLYAVLFDPLPFTAHTGTQIVAAAENTIILVLIILSLRRIRVVMRAARYRPYVMLCIVYSVAFVYLFAALSNLGLIERERVLMLPFLLVFLAIPVAPKGEPARYPWEISRRQAERQRLALQVPY